MTEALLEWAWITSNLLIAGAVLADLWFVFFYGIAFPWWQYPLGRATFAVGIALLGQVSKSFLGTFIDPQVVQWWQLPPGVASWRVIYSVIVSAIVLGTVLNVNRILWLRRFHPELSPSLESGAFTPKRDTSR